MTVYTQENCHLCESALRDIGHASEDANIPIILDEVDIHDEGVADEYGDTIPCVFLGDEQVYEYRVDTYDLRQRLAEFADASAPHE